MEKVIHYFYKFVPEGKTLIYGRFFYGQLSSIQNEFHMQILWGFDGYFNK